MKKLDFAIPFSGFTTTDFINCFTCVYMHLEGIKGSDKYECAKKQGRPCDNCGNCRRTLHGQQEQLFFLFDTMCGRSALRLRYDGALTEWQKRIGETEASSWDTEESGCGTDETVEFLFGFAGYEYKKVRADFKAAIVASIDAGRPVIAKVKAGAGRFRVIIGYDGDKLLEPDYKGAQKAPKKALKYDALEALYVIGDKTPPRFLVEDGLKRIIQVMEHNAGEKLWDGYTERMDFFGYRGYGFETNDNKERAARMKRVAETMWHTFNCHNFAEVFRKYRPDDASNLDDAAYAAIGDMKRLRNPALKASWDKISGPCNGYTHDLAWSLIGLEECADWKRHAAGYFGEMAQLTLYKIKENDEEALMAMKQALAILEEETQ